MPSSQQGGVNVGRLFRALISGDWAVKKGLLAAHAKNFFKKLKKLVA
jgi:hypothetical protein